MLEGVKSYFRALWKEPHVAAKAFRWGFSRAYHAAKPSRLELGWVTQPTSIIQDLKAGLRIVRSRSRESCQNNDYSKRWLCLLDENVVGDKGIKFQAKVTRQDGEPNEEANKMLEARFKAWGKLGVCDVTGKLSWIDAQKFWLRSTARDGEVLVRLIRGAENEFGFALQFIEIDRLDETYFANLPNGNTISMGVERNPLLRPVAYHLTPGELFDGGTTTTRGTRQRIPADEIIHAGLAERANQPRYAPWNTAALIRLQYLSGYEEAEIVAARTASCKMGVLEKDETATGEYTGDGPDAEGHPTIEAEPGSFPTLPPGYHLKPWNPEHPTTAFKDFMKAVLRGISSGLNMSYNALTSDLEGVSFSSLRSGELKERDSYRSVQQFMVEHFCEVVFEAWLQMAALSNALPIRADEIDALSAHIWQPRGWDWVDPLKDITANAMAIKEGLGSRTMFLAQRGHDFEDVVKQLAREKELAEQHGIELSVDPVPQATKALVMKDQVAEEDERAMRDLLTKG